MGYHFLNHTFQNQLNGLYGVYSYLKLRPIINGSYDGLTDEQVAKMNGTLHPLITMHPETGERNIYANPAHTLYIVNNTLDKGAAGDDILRDLFEIASRPEVTYRHKWRPDDLVMWDNRGDDRICYLIAQTDTTTD
jgi:taurine dioxygenase